MVLALDVSSSVLGFTDTFMKLAVVVPAHNEQNRIGAMLDAYLDFFSQNDVVVEFIVVLNGCTDDTQRVVQDRLQRGVLTIIDMPDAGKGLAIKRGFQESLKTDAQLIGFVDADMATKPYDFYELIKNGTQDGIIASRYMKESKLFPPRPAIKEWGRRLVYQPLVRLLFGMNFKDYQCGAKLFKRTVIERVTPHLSVAQWAFDVELLYLCKRFGFLIQEFPTVWYDQDDSKLRMKSGFRMLGSLFAIRNQHAKRSL